MITVKNFPLPPTANHLFINARGGGRVKGPGYRRYAVECEHWRYRNLQRVALIRSELQNWPMIRIDTIFVMPRISILCKDGRPKRNDTSNRIKACHDLLADMLCLDDSRFWAGSFDKIPSDPQTPAQVLIRISPYTLDPDKILTEFRAWENWR